MKIKLTGAFVQAVKAPQRGQLDYWDGAVTGFGLRVSQSGHKSWNVVYRMPGDSRLRRYTIGDYPALSLADARSKAKQALGDVEKGVDPAAEKRKQRVAETFGELADLYIERWAKPKKRSWRQDEWMINRHLNHWRTRKAASIERKDVIALLDKIAEGGAGIMANRIRALTSKIFNFAIARDIVPHNPAYKVPRPAQERQRDRVLSAGEIRAVWTALDSEPTKIASAFRMALLTAQRKSEVLGMAWDELDLDAGWWTIPADRAKNKRAHRVPLCPQTLALLEGQRAAANGSAYVFASRRLDPMALGNVKKPLIRIKKASEVDFKFHDLRRTAASHMTGIGIARLVVSKILNHVEQSITAVYDRHSYDSEKRDALLKWERRLIEIVEGREHQKVVAMRAA